MLPYKKISVIVAALFFAILIFVSCIENNQDKDIRGAEYAGSQTCVNCHKDISEHYLHNAHERTSRLASGKNISGNFTAPNNVFAYNDSEKIIMRKTDSGFYQTQYIHSEEKRSERFDIVVGSGRKAQTYLYYKGDKIYELPVSYFISIGAWANSPGYPVTHPYFDRDIPSACFGCHGSAAKVTLENPGSLRITEKYTPGQLMLGIDCERCHGPAKAHVEYQSAHPNEKTAKFIVNIKTLTKTQQMDMCSLCHSGVRQPIQPIFSFRPGDKLDNFYYPYSLHTDAGALDVHDSQSQSIMASQCFIKSNTLTCVSCHDPHQKERDNISLFSQRCMTCHSEANHNFCSLATTVGAVIKTNCIDCHMPAQPSKLIQMLSDTNGKKSLQPDYIRTHIVAIYPEETKKVLALLKKKELK